LSHRSRALWILGFPQAALADTDHVLKDAREIGQAATLLYALFQTSLIATFSGNYATANTLLDEVVTLAGEKGALFWKTRGMVVKGCVAALTGKASRAVQLITSGITGFRSTGSTLFMPWYSSSLAKAHAQLDQFDDAWRCAGEALTTLQRTKERWFEAEVHRTAGEIALMSHKPDAKAERYFERAIAVARQQQAKSWELRAAMSMARLWRDQGKRDEARELLGPIYGWFTEGFDTLDLKEAKALLEELAA
jgi:predicted ATPase